MSLKCLHNYGRFDLVFDYSVSLLERHLSLVRSPVFAFGGLLSIDGRACGDSSLINVSVRIKLCGNRH